MSHQQLPDFDAMARMAREEPEALEALRLRMIEALIEEAGPERSRRMRGLQFQIDMARKRSQNPMAACIRISAMMQTSLLELQRALNNEAGDTAPTESAKVIPMARTAD